MLGTIKWNHKERTMQANEHATHGDWHANSMQMACEWKEWEIKLLSAN